jgi:hypothetical protein
MIGNAAFQNCNLLHTVELGDSLHYIDGYAFDNCSALSQIRLPDAVETIMSAAFRNCDQLHTVSIGKGLKQIAYGAFAGCDTIEHLSINCERVFETFRNMTNLKRVYLGENVKDIPIRSFDQMKYLDTLVVGSTAPPKAELESFSNDQYLTVNVFVPTSAIEDYKADWLWRRFRNIYGMEATDIDEVRAEKPVIDFSGTGVVSLRQAQGLPICIYTIDGRLLHHIPAYSGERINLSQGLYILQINGMSYKVRLK